jgi:hypothetical protein
LIKQQKQGESGRICPLVLPQQVILPAISCQIVDRSYEPVNAFSNSGCLRTTLQVDCWDQSYSGVRTLAQETRAALMDWHQDTPPVIWRVFHTGESDDYEKEETSMANELEPTWRSS